MEKIIYLSPHLDDAVLSCGAIIRDQIQSAASSVEIWTIFSGDPPPGRLYPFARMLHLRWQTGAEGPSARREEDKIACGVLGCVPVHMDLPDCIYRPVPGTHQPRIRKNDDLFHFDPAKDNPLIEELKQYFVRQLPQDCRLVAPLGVGGHIDHLITRAAAEARDRPLLYYADFPYAGDHPEEVEGKTKGVFSPQGFPLSNDALQAWQTAISAYRSQISSFWRSDESMRSAVATYAATAYGNCLWLKAIPSSNR